MPAGCCDHCGEAWQVEKNEADEFVCHSCKFLFDALKRAKKKDWMKQFHMIRGMIADRGALS